MKRNLETIRKSYFKDGNDEKPSNFLGWDFVKKLHYKNILNREFFNEKGKNKLYLLYYDTETHADLELQKSIYDELENGKRPTTEEAGIWLACTIDFKNSENDDVFDYSIEDVLNRWDRISEEKDGDLLIYCFNLSFEWSYLKPVLFDQKFEQTFEKELKKHSFSIVCNLSESVVYEVKIKINNHLIIIRDLHRLMLGGSLGKLAEEMKLEISKGNLDEDEGGEDSYEKFRRVKNYEPTKNEKYYCFKDCKIMELIIFEKIKEYYKFCENNAVILKGVKKNRQYYDLITTTSEGLEFFTSLSTATFSCKKMIAETYPIKLVEKNEKIKIINSMIQFRSDYPKLKKEEEAFVRTSYEGGLCFPTYAFGGACTLGRFYHLDVNSQYPSQIVGHDLPYGDGKFVDPEEVDLNDASKMYVLEIRYKYKKCNFIPSLNLTGVFGIWLSENINKMKDEDFSHNPKDREVLYVWSFYLDALKVAFSDFEYKIVRAMCFKCKRAPFADYFQNHFNLKNKYKKEGKDAEKMTEKYLLNSPTGKLGEKTKNFNIKIDVDEEGYFYTFKKELEENDPNYKEIARFAYVPLISAITAWARRFLILTAYKFGFENVAYCDTDSLFIFANEKTSKLIEDESIVGKGLMKWSREADALNPTFCKPKSYASILDEKGGVFDVKAGGVSHPLELEGGFLGGIEEDKPFITTSPQMINTKRGKVLVNIRKELRESCVIYLNSFKTIDRREEQRALDLWSDADDKKIAHALEVATKEARDSKKFNEKKIKDLKDIDYLTSTLKKRYKLG